MRLSPEEKAANRAAFRAMGVGQKAEYVLAYYKLPLVLALVAAVALGSAAYHLLTHREAALYLAYANVVPEDGLDEALTLGFLEFEGKNARASEVVCYRELYLSDQSSQPDHQYAYASKIKLMAAIDAEELDVVLMNREAYDLLSASDCLLDLTDACASDAQLKALAVPLLTTNTVVLQDNRIEVELGEAKAYEADTIDRANALDVSTLPLFEELAAEEPLYLGIVPNTPRMDAALAYLRYVVEVQ